MRSRGSELPIYESVVRIKECEFRRMRDSKPHDRVHVQVQVQVDLDQKLGWMPRRLMCETTCTEINEVLDQWSQDLPGKIHPAIYYFKVRSVEGSRYLLRHDVSSDQWYVEDIW